MRNLRQLLCGLFLLLVAAPSYAAWHEARSDHFIIYGDMQPEELRTFAGRLERFDRAVRLVRRMKDPPLTDAGRLKIFVVRNQHAVERLYGGSGVMGFYIPRASGSIAFVPRTGGLKSDKWDLDAETVFFHEYAHHLQLQSADLAVPPWLAEGFAEFFGRTQLRDDGSVVIGVPPAYRAYSLANSGGLSLRAMLGADPSLGRQEDLYSRGWLLTHYLTFNRARQGQLDRYVTAIQNGVEPRVAAEQAFGDLNDLSNQIGGYLRRNKLPHLILTSSQLQGGSISLRPLSAAESAMMPVHMRSRRGVNKKTKQEVVEDARRIAAGFPADAFVQTALAEAELDVDEFARAEQAASRAVAADPARLSALVMLGRAKMGIARKNPAQADWTSVRKWFLAANKADPEAAEPLMLYHQSFVAEGKPPPAAATKGLLYALALAPQDDRLRLAAIHQLLIDNRLEQARRYLAPYSFAAHLRKVRREAAARAMTALTAQQRDKALAEIVTIQQSMDEAVSGSR